MAKYKPIPLLARAFVEQSPDTFLAYVKSLANVRATSSKEVNAVGIVFAGSKITVRVKREPKVVTRDEVTTLAAEYKREETLILELFKKRKIGIQYADNDERRHTDEAYFRSKADAKPRKTRKRKDASKDQLQFFIGNPRLPEESSV